MARDEQSGGVESGNSGRGESGAMALLRALGVTWTRHEHEPVHTVAESAHVTAHLPGAHTKNLFLRDRTGGLWLATCAQHRRIRIRDLARAAGAKDLSFADAATLWAALGVRPGSVTPLALVNDRPPRVRALLDAQMMRAPLVNVHPLRNDATVAMAPEGLRAFLAATGHAPVEFDFDALEALAAAAGSGRAGRD